MSDLDESGVDLAHLFRTGGSWILDTPADPQPLWGRGHDVLLAQGEALVIVGGQGVGKTTLAQQLALGRAGFTEHAHLLGYPVTPNRRGTVLYLAMDRPQQAARSFRRMVGEAWRTELDQRLRVWTGPPPSDLARHPHLLRTLAREAGAETVFVDSIKDAAVGLSDDEVGGGWNRARQLLLADGVEIVELHHNRKATQGVKAAHPTIDDVYGSTWITSGAGSVLLLAGAPGDPVVTAHHLKQPASDVGPLKVFHDHVEGRSTLWEQPDLLALVTPRRTASRSSTPPACFSRSTSPTPISSRRPGVVWSTWPRKVESRSWTLATEAPNARQPGVRCRPAGTFRGQFAVFLAPAHHEPTSTLRPPPWMDSSTSVRTVRSPLHFARGPL